MFLIQSHFVDRVERSVTARRRLTVVLDNSTCLFAIFSSKYTTLHLPEPCERAHSHFCVKGENVNNILAKIDFYFKLCTRLSKPCEETQQYFYLTIWLQYNKESLNIITHPSVIKFYINFVNSRILIFLISLSPLHAKWNSRVHSV